jgi:hypothetical protein
MRLSTITASLALAGTALSASLTPSEVVSTSNYLVKQ